MTPPQDRSPNHRMQGGGQFKAVSPDSMLREQQARGMPQGFDYPREKIGEGQHHNLHDILDEMKVVAGMSSDSSGPFNGYPGAEPPLHTGPDPELQGMLSQMRELEGQVAARKRILAEQRGVEATMQALETKCDDLQSEVCQLEANLVGAVQQRSLQNEATEARADAERAQTVAQQFALEKASLEGTAQRLQDSLRQVASEAECRIMEAEQQVESLLHGNKAAEERASRAEARVRELEARLSKEDASSASVVQDLRLGLVGARIRMLSMLETDGSDLPGSQEALVAAAREGDVDSIDGIMSPNGPSAEELTSMQNAIEAALSAACIEGSVQSIQALLLCAPSNLAMQGGALLAASGAGQTVVVRLLLEYCQSIEQPVLEDARDASGRNALHLAAMGGHAETLKVLLHFGGDLDATDNEGQTVHSLARQENSDGVGASGEDSVLQALEEDQVLLYNAMQRANTFHDREAFTDSLLHLQRAASILKAEPGFQEGLTDQARYMLHRNRAHAARKVVPPQHAVIVDGAGEALLLAEARNQTNPELLELRATSSMELFNFKQAVIDYETLSEVSGDPDGAEKWKQCAWEAAQLRDANHYEVLCLEQRGKPDASTIKKSFHKLSKKWHPDRHRGNDDGSLRATAIFQRINEAYRTLSEPETRGSYDMELRISDWNVSGGETFTTAWFKQRLDGASAPAR